MTSALTVRRARVSDARSIAEVHVLSWGWAYRGLLPDAYLDGMAADLERRTEVQERRLAREQPDARTWVAERGGRIVGFASTGKSRDEDATSAAGEVYAIYLRQEEAGTGVGRALFAHAVEDLRDRGFAEATLWVLTTNARARRFYEAAGWRPDGATKRDERPAVTLDEVRYRVTLR